ncbi:TCP-1 chaperonin subunit epsilon cpn60 chaperonin family protein [Giardia duodenalis assemblage B]|uniref:T-complex protein 1 subunit epsilon n=1 Tax=Giardia duodenalis assemblage B TaxID=1394984 RepID=A0A132NPY1_GIAIN|nr:TCP-1 chaperonin subunit epsilon cpn60 chaperonin family protein [Giardia intestinalis assemblage B]
MAQRINGAQLLGVSQDENGNPVYLMREGTEKKRARGLEAHKSNITIARALANTLRTSLGPRGMDKILVSGDRELTITNDGATILERMEVDNHIARLLVDLSKCQDNEIGDGTTGVVVLAGSLLEHAETLLDKGIHPIRISDGYDMACDVAIKHLESIATTYSFSADNKEPLIKAAMTSLGSKVINRYHRTMAEVAVNAVLQVADLQRNDVDFELIKVRSKIGGKLEDIKIIDGFLIDQEMSHPGMRKSVNHAKIAVLTCPFEPPKPKTTYKIDVDSVEKYNTLYREEQQFFIDMIEHLKEAGANFVVCQWGFDDEANHLLMQNDINAVRWVKGEDIEAVALATGARIIPRFEDISSDKLGYAEAVREISLGTSSDKIMVFEGLQPQQTTADSVPHTISTVFIRGGSNMIIEEARRSLHDAMCVVRNLIRDPRVIYGGGSAEISCSLAVAEAAEHVGTVEQYALRAFSEALDIIPLTLARNSSIQPIETLAVVKAAQKKTGNHHLGIDCMRRNTIDMKEQNVFETLSSKVQQLLLATQVVRMILKIDEVIADDV